MTIYVAGRQSGKTAFLIRQSADTGAVIVAPTCQMARYIDSMARDLGLQIPPPVTVADWIRGLVRQPKDHDKTYLVDELQMALHQLNVKAATIDRNYEEMVRMFGVKETCCTRCSHNDAGQQQVTDESIRDTLMDLANYAIMTILEMDEEKGMETPDPNAASMAIGACSARSDIRAGLR